jgi:hypothetical protein
MTEASRPIKNKYYAEKPHEKDVKMGETYYFILKN